MAYRLSPYYFDINYLYSYMMD